RGGRALSRHHAGGGGRGDGAEARQLLSEECRHGRADAYGDDPLVPAADRRAARGHGRAAHHRNAHRRGLGGRDEIPRAAGGAGARIARQRRPNWRGLGDAAMRNTLVVDSREAALQESGDVILSGAAIYAEIGEIFAGLKPAPASETTIFKSVGLAIEDVATARLVYDLASA